MNFRTSPFFKVPRKISKYILNGLYDIVVLFWKLPQVESAESTVNKLLSGPFSMSRFGDGEISIIVDKANYPFQMYDKNLSDKLKVVLNSNIPSFLVGLPVGFQSLDNLKPDFRISWRAQVALTYPRFKKYLLPGKIYYNASFTRPYISYKDNINAKIIFSKIMLLWDQKDVLILEGEKSRLGTGNSLFENANSIKRILAPMHNAFSRYDELIAEVEKHKKTYLILIALGPTASVMAYDLHLRGFQAIDIGNIDIEYEWYLMGAKEKVKIKGKYTSEASGGRIVEDIFDEMYESQIVSKIL